MIYIIIGLVVLLLGFPALAIGYVLTMDGIKRQKRISQMKKFRASVRPHDSGFTDADKRTIV